MARIHHMIADACFGTDVSFESDLRGFLEKHDLDAVDVDALMAEPRRLAVYRRLVRHNVVDVVGRMLPRTRARLERAAPAEFDRSFNTFLAEPSPRTHYLRDVPAEFLEWAIPLWKDDPRTPRYLADLAAHELVHFAVAAAPTAREPRRLGEISLDRALVFSETVRLARYAFAVHELPADVDDVGEPAERMVTLVAYRDDEHEVRFIELTPVAAAIVERLIAGDALGVAIASACADRAVARTAALLAETARLLADLGDRGVLLGAGPPTGGG
jgi:hypothetical protein